MRHSSALRSRIKLPRPRYAIFLPNVLRNTRCQPSYTLSTPCRTLRRARFKSLTYEKGCRSELIVKYSEAFLGSKIHRYQPKTVLLSNQAKQPHFSSCRGWILHFPLPSMSPLFDLGAIDTIHLWPIATSPASWDAVWFMVFCALHQPRWTRNSN